MKKIAVEVLQESVDALKERKLDLPAYETPRSAGVDVRAMIDEALTIPPGGQETISTGLKVAIPEGFEIQVRPRSGLAHKHRVTVQNSPGTIDSDYRGIIGVILTNRGSEPFVVEPKERIAQLVLAPVLQIEWSAVEELSETVRGEGGFGHTGKH